MPTRDRAPVGAPCWVGLTTGDVEGARAFYSSVLGWTSSDPDPNFGGYFMFFRGEVPVAGGSGPMMPGIPDHWDIFIATDDIDAAVGRAAAAGGTVVAPSMTVGSLGKMAMVSGGDGAVIGLWEPADFPGFTVYDEAGAPRWFELHTTGYDDAVAFNADVFAWTTSTMSDTPEFRYTVAVDGETNLAGVMDASTYLPDGAPSFWTVYFGVEDVDAAVATALAHGGAVVMEAADTPYGRLAALADPTGAQFRVMQGP